MFTVSSPHGIYWFKVVAESKEAAPWKCSLKVTVAKFLKHKKRYLRLAKYMWNSPFLVKLQVYILQL